MKAIRIRSEIHFHNIKAINSHNVFENNSKNRLLNFHKNSKYQNLIKKLTTFKVMNQIQLQNAKRKFAVKKTTSRIQKLELHSTSKYNMQGLPNVHKT